MAIFSLNYINQLVAKGHNRVRSPFQSYSEAAHEAEHGHEPERPLDASRSPPAHRGLRTRRSQRRCPSAELDAEDPLQDHDDGEEPEKRAEEEQRGLAPEGGLDLAR